MALQYEIAPGGLGGPYKILRSKAGELHARQMPMLCAVTQAPWHGLWSGRFTVQSGKLFSAAAEATADTRAGCCRVPALHTGQRHKLDIRGAFPLSRLCCVLQCAAPCHRSFLGLQKRWLRGHSDHVGPPVGAARAGTLLRADPGRQGVCWRGLSPLPSGRAAPCPSQAWRHLL